MGLFNRNKKSGESNEINNFELKETLVEAALSMLESGTDYDDIDSVQSVFGYLFDIEDHGFEALFKLETDRDDFFFAAQGTSIMQLTIDDDTFKEITEKFLEEHNCISSLFSSFTSVYLQRTSLLSSLR